MKFTHKSESGQISVTIKDSANLSEVVEQFENFLKACGYHFNGELDFLEKIE